MRAKKSSGRRPLPNNEKRIKVNIYLTEPEITQLKKEHGGLYRYFAAFLRTKLLSKKTVILSRPIDPEVRREMYQLQKISGFLKLLSLKLEAHEQISGDFEKASSLISQAVHQAYYAINAKYKLTLQADKIDELLRRLAKDIPENGSAYEIARIIETIEKIQAIIEPLKGVTRE